MAGPMNDQEASLTSQSHSRKPKTRKPRGPPIEILLKLEFRPPEAKIFFKKKKNIKVITTKFFQM